ncbi:3-hydroxyacyl-CoA dehydrogenase NAD-binding domain-containing protein [Geopsychrobacter electrodiphilus]|uniref:3-hydroxyacyl-CoA dehydrogenase NAD-binding domain-containing protein n=1 Tax=Geopsychrobacter electrodiphilus TaxID=225196 RepID=UPI0003826E63|nr:3-hydroxyacyl-CoA dehydrogenase NAD-binding domain-containing protein [Geopsychrobacter electrodiphilus]
MKELQKIGVIGGGLIGMSWASLFLARGMTVVVIDPRQEAEAELRNFVLEAWPKLQALGLTTSDTVRHADFSADFERLSQVDFVQENGPDRIEIKRQLIEQIEQVIAPQVVIASSTSSLLASDIQAEARYPERILVGHPMNPPHLVPMVELVAGELTSLASLQTAETFYRQMQRVTIRVQQEVVGHLANRLTSALYREAVHIAAEGIASVEDIDKAITYGPGMRWALLGPHLTYHLGGGVGGYQAYLDHLGPTQETRWKELGSPRLTAELKTMLVAGMKKELESQDQQTLAQRRDDALVELYKLKQKYGF